MPPTMYNGAELRGHLIPNITPVEITTMDRTEIAGAIREARQQTDDVIPLTDEQAARIIYAFFCEGGWFTMIEEG